MSDSVVKLRIDSKEYDANIKRAGQALTDYFNKVKEGGGTLMHLGDGVMEAVKAMGELGTQSKNTKGALRELTQATTDMTAAYRGLTDEEKNSPLGQAMQQSIQQMTERAGDMKDAMGDVQASISNAASDTRTFDQIAGGAQLMTTGYQTLAGAAKLFGVETENNVEVLATLQAAMAVTSGLQTAQNLLQEQSALMMGVQAAQASLAAAAQTAFAAATGSATVAQRAFNVVANANPYVLLATAIIAVGSALYAFASSSSKAEREAEELAKAEEKAAKKAEDARNSFVNTAAESMNSASRLSALYVSYKNCNSEMEKTSILKQAQEEFKKLGIECNGVNDAQRLLVKDGAKVIEMIQLQGNAAAVAAIRMDAFKKSMSAILENRQAEKGFFDENDIKYAMSLAGAAVGDFDKMINGMQSRIQNLRGQLGIGKGKGGGGGRGHTGGTTTDEKDEVTKEMEANQAKITKLSHEFVTATDERRNAIIEEINILRKRNEEVQQLIDQASGKTILDAGTLFGDDAEGAVVTYKLQNIPKKIMESFENGFNTSGVLKNFISSLQTELESAEFGSILYDKLTGKLEDATIMKQVIDNLVKAGVEGADLKEIADELKARLIQGDIPDDEWEDFVNRINEKLKEIGIEPIKVNIDTKTVEEDAKNVDKNWQKAASSIGKVGSAISQLEDPAAKIIGTIGQAIATVALGYAQASATPKDPWSWIAFAATGLATMMTMISSIHSATGYAQGGIIKGNSYSGDNIGGLVDGSQLVGLNAGEVVLNHAQTETLANSLENDQQGGITSVPYVMGEQVFLGVNTYLRRTGRGELVTTKTR